MANKYVINSGGNWSGSIWNTASNQSTSNTTAPTTSDIAYLNQYSGNVNIDSASCVAQQLITTGYTRTIDSTSSSNMLAISTTTTISATTNYGATAFTLRLGTGTSTATWNLGGVTFPWDLEMNGTGTKTLSQNVTVTGVTRMKASMTVTGNNWYANGGIESDNTVNTRTMQGTVNLYVGGGNYSYIVKRTSPSKLVFQGNITIKGSYSSAQSVGIYDCIFEYVSGTISVDSDVAFYMGGTNTVSVGANIIFESLEVSGTTTLTADLYAANSVQCAGTAAMTFIGAYTVHVGYGGGTGHLISYNKGTFISTTTKISMEGTGSLFRKTSFNGMVFELVDPMQIDIDINTAGTVTFDPITTKNQFGGGRTLTYIAGTVVTTNCSWAVTTGGYNFNIDVLVPTFSITDPTATAVLLSDFDATNYQQIAGSTLKVRAGKEFKPVTNLAINGTSLAQANVRASQVLVDYVAGNNATFTDSSFAISQAPLLSSVGSSVLFQRNESLYDSWATMPEVTLGVNGSVAFTYQHRGGGTIFWGSGNYIKYDNATKKFGVYWGGAYTLSPYYNLADGDIVDVVITKATADARAKFYINGAQLADNGSYSGTTTGKTLNFYTIGYSFGNYALDEIAFYSDIKDQTWAAARYNGGDVVKGTALDTGIIAGWHMDDSMTAKITHSGTSRKISNTTFNSLDASDGYRLNSWYGASVYGCENIYVVSDESIGGGGVSVSIY